MVVRVTLKSAWILANLALMVQSGLYEWSDVLRAIETTVSPYTTVFQPSGPEAPTTAGVPTGIPTDSVETTTDRPLPDILPTVGQVHPGLSYAGLLLLLVWILVLMFVVLTLLTVLLCRYVVP